MEPGAEAMRFADTAMLLKHPVLVGVTVIFVLALLSTWIVPDGSSSGGWPWLALAMLTAAAALLAWMLGHSQEVAIDPATRRVTQWHRFLNYETAKNEWAFADFTGVVVERKTDKTESASTSPGSHGAQTSVKTTYTHSYTLSLLRADTAVATADRQISVPHYPLELPMEEKGDVLALETSARMLSRLGGWPARRRGYALLGGSQHIIESRSHDAESLIDGE